MTIGGESAMIYNNTNLAFKDIPDKFQTGFRNYVGMVGLESSANYLLKFGMENIRKKNNSNWMQILRIAIKFAPSQTAKVMSQIYKSDSKISSLVKKLTK
jgi:cysteine desulfurase/selenocysteine lyase